MFPQINDDDQHVWRPIFENPAADSASRDPTRILKFQREDWSLFRTLDGLQQRAGVPKERLRRLVLKELADNGLDAGAEVRVGELPGVGYYIEDDGPGIEPEQVASLFSIDRPMVSTKLLRLPSRGALGNGLRVVAGAVLASEGSLTVVTRNRRIRLRPERDGTTTVLEMTEVAFPIGTRVEIAFGPSMPKDVDALSWARTAIALAREGQTYNGKSSPWWYDVPQFRELLDAGGTTPVRELIANFDGCSGAKAGEIVAKAGLTRATCADVKPERLGRMGADAFAAYAYSSANGTAEIGGAKIPYVVEVWAIAARRMSLEAYVNRTPVTGQINVARDKRDIDAFGCGLCHCIAQAPKDAQFAIRLNIAAPYMPITSDGKAPNMKPFVNSIAAATKSAVRKAHRPNAGSGKTQKDVVLDNLDDVIAKVSDGGRFRFNQRQLLYALRPIVRDALDKELTADYFAGIVTDYEAEGGEIPGMYREPRGSIYHPHREEMITLGTLMVEDYDRPVWTFNKLLYIEKEGFSEALRAVRWGERHDCALMSSKGFTTRAARDLVDKLAEHDEPITIFCVHDADAFGTMIYQTFQEETRARGARKIKIINLGLEPWEAMDMGLEVEDVKESEKRKPVASYVLKHCRDHDSNWEDWLQRRRVELNAMTTPQFIEWLDGKMADYEKLIPPARVLEAELLGEIEKRARERITARILQEAGLEDQVAAAVAAAAKPPGDEIERGIRTMFEQEPEREWREHIARIAES
jgi:hypothetical protein